MLDIGLFLWARALRILPAYVACLLLSAGVLGALFTELPLREYFLQRDTLGYVLKNLKFGVDMAWNLPGVFGGNPKRATVNGSIWTLPAEVRMYLWAAGVGVLGVLSRRWLFNVVALGLFLFGLMHADHIPLVPQRAYVRLAGLFLAGALCYVNRAWVPLHGALFAALVAAAWLCRNTPAYPFLFAACEIAFVFWFAYATPWRGFNRFGDYSYGIYLWGYPAQQMVAALAPGLSFLVNALCGFVLALSLAIASWHGVEKPALRLKGLPSRLMQQRKRSTKEAHADAP